jgi:hypothetical protein
VSSSLALVPALVARSEDAKAAPSTMMLDAALRYASKGFQVFPCHSARDGRCSCGNSSCDRKAKHPRTPNGLNDATDDVAAITAWWRQWPDANIALRTGDVSGFVAYDFDGELGQAIAKDVRSLPTPVADTGGGGLHMLFAHPGHLVRTRRGVREGLDVRGDGGYIIAPPSMHASGRPYAWQQFLSPDETDPAPIPESLQSYAEAPTPKGEGTSGDDEKPTADRPDAPREIFARARRYLAKMPAAISGHGGHDATYRAALAAVRGFELSIEQARELLREFSGRCVPPWSEKELDHKLRSAMKSIRVPDGYIVKAPRAALTRTGGESASWILEMATRNLGGEMVPLPIERNINLALRNDSRWNGRILLDEFAGKVKFRDDDGVLRDWADGDATRTMLAMQSDYSLYVRSGQIQEVAAVVAEEFRFNPLRDFLNGLQWDGVDRLDRFLVDLGGADDNPYTRSVTRRWMISAVARAFEPGCRADHVLILEGEQGTRKSSTLAVLGGEYYTEWVGKDVSSKDAAIGLRGRWIVDVAELDAVSRGEASAVKAFLTAPSDSYRPPYGKLEVTHPRSCVFAGSVNEDAYLKDATGNRRYWPIKLGRRVDVESLAAIRPQLWAEAVAAYRAGVKWWLEEGEEVLAREEQGTRFEEDVWADTIREMVEGPMRHERVTISAVLTRLNVPPEHQDPAKAKRVARTLQGMGFRKRHTNKGNVWEQPEPSQATADVAAA